MATKISEDTNVQLDLKTIGIIIAGTISLASMWFTLQGDINVQKMEFKFKDELIRSNIVQIDKLTENIKEDVEENKEAIKDLENKVYKKR